jgi:hypothetical protein
VKTERINYNTHIGMVDDTIIPITVSHDHPKTALEKLALRLGVNSTPMSLTPTLYYLPAGIHLYQARVMK